METGVCGCSAELRRRRPSSTADLLRPTAFIYLFIYFNIILNLFTWPSVLPKYPSLPCWSCGRVVTWNFVLTDRQDFLFNAIRAPPWVQAGGCEVSSFKACATTWDLRKADQGRFPPLPFGLSHSTDPLQSVEEPLPFHFQSLSYLLVDGRIIAWSRERR